MIYLLKRATKLLSANVQCNILVLYCLSNKCSSGLVKYKTRKHLHYSYIDRAALNLLCMITTFHGHQTETACSLLSEKYVTRGTTFLVTAAWMDSLRARKSKVDFMHICYDVELDHLPPYAWMNSGMDNLILIKFFWNGFQKNCRTNEFLFNSSSFNYHCT